MTELRIFYDHESDMLEVLFAEPTVEEQAYQLSFNIILFINSRTGKPINLTILDYQQLLQLDKISLDKFKKMPAPQQRKMRALISGEPLCNFLEWVDEPRLKQPHVRILNPAFQELLAA